MTIYTRFNEKATKVKKLEMLKNHYKTIADVLSSKEVQDILKKWGGKKYTKRLITALTEIDKRFDVDTRIGKYLEFNFFNDRSFQADEGTVYIDYRHTLGNIAESSFGEGESIVASNIDEKMLEVSAYYNQQYQKLNNQLSALDEYLKEFQEIVNKYNAFEEKVDADIRAEFNLNLTSR